MGRAMLSKSLIQFSVEGQDCVPCLLLDLRPDYAGDTEDDGYLLQKVPCMHCYTHSPHPAASHQRPMPPPETRGHSWASLDQSLGGATAPFLVLFVPSLYLYVNALTPKKGGFVCWLPTVNNTGISCWHLFHFILLLQYQI